MVNEYSDSLIPTNIYFKMFIEAEKVKFSFFEKICKTSYRFLKVRCPSFLKKKLEDHIFLSDLKVTEDEVFSLTITSFVLSFLIFLGISLLDFPSAAIVLIFPPFIAYNVFSYPIFYSEVIRIRAGNETVSIILYLVTYLSLNPVYEKAIEYAASRCHGPLGNDLKKVVWDIQSGISANVKDALSKYSKKWTLWNEEFVNCLIMLQLIEVHPTEEGRSEILKEATSRIMTSTATKMEDYAFKLKVPSIFILLFGITMPLMGLVMFPMISIFLTNSINPLYIGIGYTVILPFFLWWFLYRLISKRPATYSHSEKLESVPPLRYMKFLGINAPIIPIAVLLGFLITIPGLVYFIELYSARSLIFSHYPAGEAILKWGEYCLNRYEPENILKDTFRTMFIIWGISFSIIFATYFRSKGPYEFELFVRKLEEDFEGGLFELQSALRQNIAIETAILKVIDNYKRLRKEKNTIAIFFLDLYRRILRTGVTIQEALFGNEGLVTRIPSDLVKNIMGIVSSSLSKGAIIASGVIRNIVSYLIQLKDIEHTIKKSMTEIISNLTMQGKFIGPFIGGIVAASAVIMIQLLQAVAKAIESIERMYNFGTNTGSGMQDTLNMLDIKRVMPPTVMELIGGLYLIEVAIIVAIFITGLERGFNKVHRDHYISEFLIWAVILFTIVFFLMVLMFQGVVTQIKI